MQYSAYSTIIAGMEDPADFDIAAEAWHLMSQFAQQQFRSKSRSVHDLGLTPGHTKILMTLEPGESKPMGTCAGDVGCDASTATWLVDRLEERALVERKPSTTDRRVKGVVLTPRGAELQAQLRAAYQEPPPALLALDRPSLEQLLSGLRRLTLPEGQVAKG
ncbi:MAG: MarR family winged helix-turn-helix transcriptional regulator [Actinomycetota bacterium]